MCFRYFPFSNTPDSNERVINKFLQSLIMTHSFESGVLEQGRIQHSGLWGPGLTTTALVASPIVFTLLCVAPCACLKSTLPAAQFLFLCQHIETRLITSIFLVQIEIKCVIWITFDFLVQKYTTWVLWLYCIYISWPKLFTCLQQKKTVCFF